MAGLPPQPIGQSESFLTLLDRVSDAAALEKPVLVVGERGTGKELIASRLHFLSPRWEKIFITVNCAAYTDADLDRELFGESFLDGREDTNGRFYHADEGTLFLDNIDTVSPRLQEKLMRAVEYGSFEASGEAQTQDVDVRVLSATGVDLPAAVARGAFRADLLDRLAFDVITLPPLRVRPDDISPLAEHFGRKIASELGAQTFPGFSAEAMETLERANWPGNVRELKTIVERSTARAWLQDESLSEPITDLVVDPFDAPYRLRDAATPLPPSFPAAPQGTPPVPERPRQPDAEPPMPAYALPSLDAPEAQPTAAPSPAGEGFAERVMTFERRLIDNALRAAGGHQGRAAERLELSYHQFRGLLRKHGLKK